MQAGTGSKSTDGDRDDLATLLVRCGQGDQVAFACLYDAVAPRAFGVAARVLRDWTDAEDATHEAFIELWRGASRFDPARGSGHGWIFTIVRRKAVDRLRSRTASSRREMQSFRLTWDGGEYDVTSEGALQRLDAQHVRSALEPLTRLQREAIELAYFQGLTNSEVAAVLGIPVSTVKSRIRAGLIQLRGNWTDVAA